MILYTISLQFPNGKRIGDHRPCSVHAYIYKFEASLSIPGHRGSPVLRMETLPSVNCPNNSILSLITWMRKFSVLLMVRQTLRLIAL